MSTQLYHLSTSKSFFMVVGPNNPIEGFILVPCCSLKATLQHCLVSQADIYGLDQLENSNDHGGQTQLERQPACATSHTRSQQQGGSVGATLKIILEFLVIFKFEIYYPTVLKYE